MNTYNLRPIAVFMAFAALLASPFVWGEEAEFVGQKDCKMCHNKKPEGAQWTVWKSMKHANAFATLQGEKALEVAKRLGLEKPPSESEKCLRCHVTAYDVETKSVPAKIKFEDSVQCESCHGPASLHLPDGKAVMFKKDDSVDISAHISRPTEETCLQCHNSDNPNWDPERYTAEDGKKVGFDFKWAYAQISHLNPKKAK